MNIYTLELFQYNTDKRRSVRVHNGTFEQNRDLLTPVMIWHREYYAKSKKDALNKARLVCKEYNYKLVR